MPTIKGPINLKGGLDASFLAEKGINVKLPFKATGWKSSKMPKGVKLVGIETAPEPKKPATPKESEAPKETVVPKEEPAKEERITGGEIPDASKFKKELTRLHGIGPATADKIIALAKNKNELMQLSHDLLIKKLPDDVVEVIERWLGGN